MRSLIFISLNKKPVLINILEEINSCTICKENLPLGPRPILKVSSESKILIIGQAPGTKVHASGIPWDDQSGKELRRWLGVDKEIFYDTSVFGIMPMGFCYPGKGKSGDLPPRPECAPAWHRSVLNYLPQVKLTLLIGQYSQKYYIGSEAKNNLTETVRNFHYYLPDFFPLVHPSPRNKIWQKRNPWFEENVVPELREVVLKIIGEGFMKGES